MTNTQDKWYELTLSKNMSSAKKKLNVLRILKERLYLK